MQKSALVVALVVISLACAAPSSAQLVNGSFEPGSSSFNWQLIAGGSVNIPGWMAIDNGVEWFHCFNSAGIAAPDGQYVVDIATYTWSAGGIQQTFPTIPGEIHTINFMLGTHATAGRDGTCQINVSADGLTQTFSHVNYASAPVFAPKTFVFLADDNSATISFRCLQDANLHFAYLDAVGLTLPVASEGSSFGSVKALFR